MTLNHPESEAGASTRLQRPSKGVTRRRRTTGLVVLLIALPVITAALVQLRSQLELGSVLLLYLLAVVVISVIGGLVAGILAACASFAFANFYFTPPFHTFVVERRDSIITLLVFLLVAVTVSALVDVAGRLQTAAQRSRAEARLLDRVAAAPLASRSPEDVLKEVATTFSLTSVALIRQLGATETVLAQVGSVARGPRTLTVSAGPNLALVGEGRELFAEDRGLLTRLAHAAAEAFDARQLASTAERAQDLAEIDRLRSALLAAVGHDLRTPLANIKAAATTLTQTGVHIASADRADLMTNIIDSADHLADLIANLLDLSRLEAGALNLNIQPVSLEEMAAQAVIDRHLQNVTNDVADDLPMVLADPGLLERIVANLIDNASRYSPPGTKVTVSGGATDDAVVLQVVDHGPGVAEADWDSIFVPFQRLDDRSSDVGVGLGLAIARGFTDALGGTLTPSHTFGGGLTMTLTLPRVRVSL